MCWMLCKHFCEQAAVHRAVGLGDGLFYDVVCGRFVPVNRLWESYWRIVSMSCWRSVWVRSSGNRQSRVWPGLCRSLRHQSQSGLCRSTNLSGGAEEQGKRTPAPFRFTDELWERLLNEQMCSLDTKILILSSFTHPHDVPQEFCQNSYS